MSSFDVLRQSIRDVFPAVVHLGQHLGVEPKIGVVLPPKSSILIGFFIIFTIHFGGKHPNFWKHQFFLNEVCLSSMCDRVDQLPLFPYNRGWETQPNSVGLYRAP